MGVDRCGPWEHGVTNLNYSIYLTSPDVSSQPHSMEVVEEAEWGCSVGDARVGYEGADERVRL